MSDAPDFVCCRKNQGRMQGYPESSREGEEVERRQVAGTVSVSQSAQRGGEKK